MDTAEYDGRFFAMIGAALVGCYVLTSLVMFRFPTLIHKKKNVKFICRHISHRGGAGENYENTMTAFRSSIEKGTDMLELDCQLTRDGCVIVSHDNDLEKRTGVSGSISDCDYSDLPPLLPVVSIDFMPGEVFSGTSEDRRFPLLEEVFQSFPQIPVNIDIKVNSDLLISKVNELIKKYQREHLTVWGNLSDVVTRKCFLENPDICLLFSFHRVLVLLLLLYTGLLPFIPLKETHLEIFVPSHMQRIFGSKYGSKWWHVALSKLADMIFIRRFLFNHLAKRGIQTYLWVMNTEEDFAMAFKTGATGVMTDYPTLLRNFLDANPHIISDFKNN